MIRKRVPRRAFRIAMLLLSICGIAGVPRASAAQPAPVHDTLCLAIRLVDSDGAAPRWGDVHFPPDTIALDSVPLEYRGESGFLIRPEPANLRDGQHLNPFARRGVWRADGDSLRLVWNSGLAGVDIRGVVHDSTFSGIATIITDVRSSRPDQPVRATGRKVACPDGILQRAPS